MTHYELVSFRFSRGRGRKNEDRAEMIQTGEKQPINKAGRKSKRGRKFLSFWRYGTVKRPNAVSVQSAFWPHLWTVRLQTFQMSSGHPWRVCGGQIKSLSINLLSTSVRMLRLTNSRDFKEFQTCCISRRWLCNSIPCKHSCSSRKCLHPSVEDRNRPCHTCNKGG